MIKKDASKISVVAIMKMLCSLKQLHNTLKVNISWQQQVCVCIKLY